MFISKKKYAEMDREIGELKAKLCMYEEHAKDMKEALNIVCNMHTKQVELLQMQTTENQ
jgi:hypothetical protein